MIGSNVSWLGGAFLIRASIAVACPICHTEIGEQVRAGIFDADFWTNMLFVLAPFPVLLLLAAALHYGFGRGFASASRGAPSQSDPVNDVNDVDDKEGEARSWKSIAGKSIAGKPTADR